MTKLPSGTMYYLNVHDQWPSKVSFLESLVLFIEEVDTTRSFLLPRHILSPITFWKNNTIISNFGQIVVKFVKQAVIWFQNWINIVQFVYKLYYKFVCVKFVNNNTTICQILMQKRKFSLRFDQNCNKFWSNFEYRGRVFCIDKKIFPPPTFKNWAIFDTSLIKVWSK